MSDCVKDMPDDEMAELAKWISDHLQEMIDEYAEAGFCPACSLDLTLKAVFRIFRVNANIDPERVVDSALEAVSEVWKIPLVRGQGKDGRPFTDLINLPKTKPN